MTTANLMTPLFDMPQNAQPVNRQNASPTVKPPSPINYLADHVEAVIYLVSRGLSLTGHGARLMVTRRWEAQEFCSHPATSSQNNRSWMTCFTTYAPDWRDEMHSFIVDDGRFNPVLKELGITPIYRKTNPLTTQPTPER